MDPGRLDGRALLFPPPRHAPAPAGRRRVRPAAAIAVTACAPGGAPAGGAPASDVQGTVVWSTRVQTEENLWQQSVVLPRLKEKFPKINLSFETAPANEWAVKLISLYAAGTPPDVHHGFAGIVISLYAQEQALELTPYIKRDRFDLAAVRRAPERSGHVPRAARCGSLPIDSSLGDDGVLQRRPACSRPGVPLPPTSWQDRSWTWDRVLDIARRTTRNWGEADAVYGFIGTAANPWFQIWPYLWGGDLLAQGVLRPRHRADQPADHRAGGRVAAAHPGPGPQAPGACRRRARRPGR